MTATPRKAQRCPRADFRCKVGECEGQHLLLSLHPRWKTVENVNNIRERVEKQLRFFFKLTVNASAGEIKFTEANKEKTLQNLRAVLGEVKRQEDYIKLSSC